METTVLLKHIITTTAHYGHKISIGHLRLSKEEKVSIAGQLMLGVNFEHILDKIRDSIGTKEKLQRIHLLVKKDLYNIERAFGLRGCQRHSNDATSVQIMGK